MIGVQTEWRLADEVLCRNSHSHLLRCLSKLVDVDQPRVIQVSRRQHTKT